MAKKRTTRKKSGIKAPSMFRLDEAGLTGGELPPEYTNYVIAQLKYDSPVAYTPAGFGGPELTRETVDVLNQVLSSFKVKSLQNLFDLKAERVAKRVLLASVLPEAAHVVDFADKGMDAQFIQSGFVAIVPQKPKDAELLANALRQCDAIWNAYLPPRPSLPGASGSTTGTRLFEPAQGYLYCAPDGIGAAEAWKLKGADGSGVTVCDVEYDWNFKHEDLPGTIKLLGGTVTSEISHRNHGTAVLGEMLSLKNKYGTIGICPAAAGRVQSPIIDGQYNLAAALINVGNKLSAGDVVLIEQQATGPNGKYVAMQYWDDTFSAIKTLTEKGILVVEAAGNGNEDFDLPIFNNTGLQKDSGAIVVGAAVPPANHIDGDGWGSELPAYGSLGVPRSRIFFSNYGKILSVQAWGWHVTSLGYGDLQGDSSENKWYTLRFSGTSSASPIVTGAVACLQGYAKAKTGSPLTPAMLRKILISTGTVQAAGPGVPLTQKIGPQPNLVEALKLVT